MVMTFVGEGKLSLENTIGRFLPVMTANGQCEIKIWQYLSHLTEIKTGSLKEWLNEMKELNSMDEAMNAIANNPWKVNRVKHFIRGTWDYKMQEQLWRRSAVKVLKHYFLSVLDNHAT